MIDLARKYLAILYIFFHSEDLLLQEPEDFTEMNSLIRRRLSPSPTTECTTVKSADLKSKKKHSFE